MRRGISHPLLTGVEGVEDVVNVVGVEFSSEMAVATEVGN